MFSETALVCRTVACLALVAGWTVGTTWGQDTQPAEPTTQPTTAPAERTPITARVLEVRGDAKHAPLGSKDWQPCQVDDEYPEETVLLTGVRSSVKLQIGTDDTYTALVIEPASKTLLSEAYTTEDTKRVNIGVGYGRIRAGVVEGGLKSDFTVESPVATLSKRGTWNFGLYYERGTDRFEIFLLDRGLIDAFSRVTGQRRRVLPGQLVNQIMRRWLDEAKFHHTVPISDILGQGDMEVAFNRMQQDGLRVLNPDGGQTVLIDLSSAASRAAFARLARENLPTHTPQIRPGRQVRAEGFFGTGRGEQLIPLIIGSDSTLAKNRLAQPGTYTFRRSALESWLRQQGNK